MLQRFVVTALLAAVLAAGAWMLWHRPATTPPPLPTRTLKPNPTPTATLAPRAAGEFRLAGTAVGEPNSWAAIDDPGGVSHLYRNGEDVPELGRIVGIYPDHVILDGPEGEVRLNLKPAPTPTPDRRRTTSTVTPARVASPANADKPQQ